MKSYPVKFESFNGQLSKWEPCKGPYKPLKFFLPNPYKLSILRDILRAIILPVSSSK